MMTKHLKYLFLFVAALSGSIIANSQTSDKPYEVAIWHGFAQTTINYTFDDGCSNQFAIARPMFDKFGFPMTLFTVTNWASNWPTLKLMAAKGHEIANHSVSHPNLGNITIENQIAELKNSSETIFKQIPGFTWQTHAYPFCVKVEDSLASKYFIAARGCQGFIEGKTPLNYSNVSSVVVGSEGVIKTVANFKTNFENAAKKNGWLVLLMHGIDADGGYSPISSKELQKSLEFLSPRTSKFWVTTFGNSARYAKERNAVTVKEILNQDTLMTLAVTDTLVDSIYNLPLSIRRPLPKDWPSADVTQNGIGVPMRIVKIDTVIYLTFDVVPDAGEVKLLKNNTSVTPAIDTIPADIEDPTSNIKETRTLGDINVSITNQILYVSLPSRVSSEYSITLYNLSGTSLFSRKEYNFEGNNNLSFGINPVKAGLYIVKVCDSKNFWSKKIILT